MAPSPMLLADVLGEIPNNKGILVRVIRLWIVTQRFQPHQIRSICMVLQDEDCTRIHATVQPDLWPSFKNLIDEHGLYAMKNFHVKTNDVLFKPAPHPFRLFFKKQTILKPYDLDLFPIFPRTLYNFKSFEQVMSTPPADTTYLIDYIGVLLPREITQPGVSNTTGSKYFTFHLTGLEMKRISCWLWEAYADEASEKLATMDRNRPIVILLQLCRIRREDSVSIQTSFHVSKVIIDEHLPEIEDFRIIFMATYQSTGQASGGVSSYSGSAATFGPTITLAKLKSSKEPKGYWFYGEIERVLSRNNWCYPSCLDNSCAKKVDSVCDEFLFSKCHKTTMKPMYKYCMKLSVQHDDEFAAVLLWDEVCQLLLGKTALELRSLVDQVEGVRVTPDEINNLVGEWYFFKISNHGPNIGGGRTYTISAFCNDAEILEMHKPKNTVVVVEDNDSDDNLDLMFPMETTVESNQANVPQIIEELDEPANTPSSKHHMDDDDDVLEDTPTSRSSTSNKLKTVKKEKP